MSATHPASAPCVEGSRLWPRVVIAVVVIAVVLYAMTLGYEATAAVTAATAAGFGAVAVSRRLIR